MSCQIAIRAFWALGCTTLIFLSACGGQTDPAEIKARPNQPIAVAMLNVAPTSACPSGGITIQSGIDVNANQVLELAEATSTQYVCNGADGPSGLNGLDGVNGLNRLNAQVLITAEAPGLHCATGGSLVSVGVDLNSNSILESTEVTSFNYICNAANGTNGSNGSNGTSGLNSLVTFTTVPAGANCTYGGSKATAGLDSNTNRLLDAPEITSTTYICNGSPGATGATGETGPSGGGLSAYAYIYNLTPQTVEVMTDTKFEKSAVLFDSHGLMLGVQHEPGSDQIIIDNNGVYYLNFSISGTEPNQFAIFVNDKVAAGSIYGSGAGTQQTFGQVIIELSRGDVVRLVNHSSDAAVGLVSVIGGTQANVNASMVIQKLN